MRALNGAGYGDNSSSALVIIRDEAPPPTGIVIIARVLSCD